MQELIENNSPGFWQRAFPKPKLVGGKKALHNLGFKKVKAGEGTKFLIIKSERFGKRPVVHTSSTFIKNPFLKVQEEPG